MIRRFVLALAVALLAFVLPAQAEPIRLKLSFFSSDRELAFWAAIDPFINVVNREGEGFLQIEPHTSGALGKGLMVQRQLVVDGTADIAFVNPSLTPDAFPDQSVMQLPGLFRSAREATLVYTNLTQRGVFEHLAGFVVIAAFVNHPLTIHTRPQVKSLADLVGKRLRVNNAVEGQALNRLGALPQPMAINEVADAISRGALDGATVPPGALFEFGIARVASNHYLLQLGGAPLLLLMNKQRFESLPPRAQQLIRKYSGSWIATRYADAYERHTKEAIDEIHANPRRMVVEPSAKDLAAAQAAFELVAATWRKQGAREEELYAIVQQELARVRANPANTAAGGGPGDRNTGKQPE